MNKRGVLVPLSTSGVNADWQRKSLISVSTAFRDGDWIESKDQASDGIRLIQTGNVGVGRFKDRVDKARYISEVTSRRLRCEEIFRGDCLISRLPDPVGRACIVPETGERMITAVDCTIVRFDTKAVMPEFFIYYSQSNDYLNTVASKCTGTTRNRISRANLAELELTLPSIREQARIIAILDEAFEGIARAKRNAEQNFLNAQSIFDDSVKALITSENLDWPLQTLGQICQVERGSSPRPIKNYFTTASDGVNWIKIGDTVEGAKYIHTTKQRITAEGAKQSRFVQEGDFVLTNSMSFGRSYIMKTSGYIHDGWFVLRLKSSIDRDYLYYLLTSKYIRDQFNELASGSVVLNISGDLVKRATLPVPPIKDQLDLVRRLDTLSAETKNLQAIYERKITELDALKQSLLNAAFSGNL